MWNEGKGEYLDNRGVSNRGNGKMGSLGRAKDGKYKKNGRSR